MIRTAPEANYHILRALEHVREHCPNTRMVVFNSTWDSVYLDDDLFPVDFPEGMDEALLDAAEASIQEVPAVFEVID